ncbi:MAG: hypothetical protein GQ470_01805 [Gammaproteobacteria bacterium]|nr:hypothetical protein [Gammaproteobacteria bacterium]
MKYLHIKILLLLSTLSIQSVEAIPAFARQYQFQCSGCHDAVPMLNPAGQMFLNNGYRFSGGDKTALSRMLTDSEHHLPMAIELSAGASMDSSVDGERNSEQMVMARLWVAGSLTESTSLFTRLAVGQQQQKDTSSSISDGDGGIGATTMGIFGAGPKAVLQYNPNTNQSIRLGAFSPISHLSNIGRMGEMRIQANSQSLYTDPFQLTEIRSLAGGEYQTHHGNFSLLLAAGSPFRPGNLATDTPPSQRGPNSPWEGREVDLGMKYTISTTLQIALFANNLEVDDADDIEIERHSRLLSLEYRTGSLIITPTLIYSLSDGTGDEDINGIVIDGSYQLQSGNWFTASIQNDSNSEDSGAIINYQHTFTQRSSARFALSTNTLDSESAMAITFYHRL